jgi:hypothetical protein
VQPAIGNTRRGRGKGPLEPQGLLRLKRSVFQNAVDGAETVLPANFLALFKGSAVVGDAYFVDADFGDARNFGRHLGFKAKALFGQMQRLHHFALEELVAGFHIRQVQVGEHVGEEGEEFVAQGMPEKQDAVRVAAHEARSVNDVRLTGQHGL